MIWRLKNWTKRSVWRLASRLAKSQGIDLNRAVYIGPDHAVLEWAGVVRGHRIHGAAVGLQYDGETVRTVFAAAPAAGVK